MTDLCTELMTVFELNDVSVCIKDINKTVLMQNELCIDVCGNQMASQCTKGCMELYENDKNQQWKNLGSRVYKNIAMENGYFDVHLLCGEKHIVTFLTPLKKQQREALSFYEDKGLTRRETEVIAMVIQGNSNKYITEQLAISKATLKSHLNNIYRKTREKGAKPEFIPANRVTS